MQSRFNDMIASAKTFIDEFIADGSAVGIVEFDSSAYIRSHMVVIRNDNDRQSLKNTLPTTPDGGTAIGAGILKAIEVS